MGAPVLTNIHGGQNLYEALIVPPGDLGTPEQTRLLSADSHYQRVIRLMGEHREVEAYRQYMRGSLRLISKNHWRYLGAVAFRVVKLWRLAPYRRSYSYGYGRIFWLSLLSDGLAIPLGLLGLWSFRRRWDELLPLHLAAGLWTLAYALVYVVMRYRMPVIVVMILFAAAWLDRVLPKAGRAGGA